jgi:hypothetical protein
LQDVTVSFLGGTRDHPNDLGTGAGDRGGSVGPGGAPDGDWYINANGSVGRIIFSGGGASLVFGGAEQLERVTFDAATGRVTFYRTIGDQPHTGVLVGREIQGTFDSYGRGPYLWCATLEQSCTPGTQRPNPVPPKDAAGPEQVVFQHFTNAGLQSGPPSSPSRFTLDRARTITRLRTYHWNQGRGTPAPGTIGVQGPDGRVYGPWQAAGTPGQGGVPNANWEVEPAVTLAPGTYTVLDSDPASWGYNAETGGQGIIWVYARD